MAPMIDMVFLLLVFFMTVSTMAQDERVALELPESGRAHIPDDPSHRGNLSLVWHAPGEVELFVGAQPATLAELKAEVREALATNPDLEINLRASRDTPFAEIRQVLQACAEVGAHKIIYATYQAP